MRRLVNAGLTGLWLGAIAHVLVMLWILGSR